MTDQVEDVQMQAASNAKFTVNGIAITRASNEVDDALAEDPACGVADGAWQCLSAAAGADDGSQAAAVALRLAAAVGGPEGASPAPRGGIGYTIQFLFWQV